MWVGILCKPKFSEWIQGQACRATTESCCLCQQSNSSITTPIRPCILYADVYVGREFNKQKLTTSANTETHCKLRKWTIFISVRVISGDVHEVNGQKGLSLKEIYSKGMDDIPSNHIYYTHTHTYIYNYKEFERHLSVTAASTWGLSLALSYLIAPFNCTVTTRLIVRNSRVAHPPPPPNT